MKKILLFTFLVLGFAGCTVEPEQTGLAPDAKESTSSVVPVEEALKELYAVMGVISSKTRSGEAFDYTKAIREINVSGGSQATRSAEGDLPDTMVYVVNFSNDKGFAVLGAQRALEPVYAITESGSFDANKLNAAIAQAQQQMLKGKEGTATRTEGESEVIQEIGTDYAYILLAESMVAAPRISADTISVSYGPWVTNGTIGPLVDVKWGQAYPFNMSMPETTLYNYDNEDYNSRFPVGCSMVAAAQAMTCVRRPTLAPAGSANYNWTPLKTVSGYTNSNLFKPGDYPKNVSTDTQVYTQQLADVLYHLSVCFNATSSATGTGAYAADVASGLKTLDPIYYNKARVVPALSNIAAIRNNLNNNKPMYMSGYQYDNTRGMVGHAWVVDGYINRSRTVTTKIRYGFTGPVTTLNGTEQGNFMHLNWGYRGSYDGYFAEGIFNSELRVFKDDIIDTNTSDWLGSMNYDTNIEVILY